ncbi:MAG: hypothetical protein JST93_22965 [Acidobacteria bacterium]|nr:hypothetical protein [Acidobacteriota bacterium]
MSDHQCQEIIAQFKKVTSIDLNQTRSFRILKKHTTASAPFGFDFSVENPRGLAELLRGNTNLAEDPEHIGHYSPWDARSNNYGFTEITQPDLKSTKWPKALHIDFAIGKSACPCGMHLDDDHRVIGRDRYGNAVTTYADHPIVKEVIHEVSLRRIPLGNFKLRPIKVYDDPEPRGFDFESPDIAAIENIVRNLSTHNEPSPPLIPRLPNLDSLDFSKKPNSDAPYRHDNSRDVTGWVGNRVTLGQGYREKGFGPRVHIELDKDSGLGNVHLDTHPYLNLDGTPNLKEAIDHGIYDLAPGFGLAGRTKRYTWRVTVGGSVTPSGSRDSVEVGVPIKPAGDSGPIGGWTIGVGVEIRPRRRRR